MCWTSIYVSCDFHSLIKPKSPRIGGFWSSFSAKIRELDELGEPVQKPASRDPAGTNRPTDRPAGTQPKQTGSQPGPTGTSAEISAHFDFCLDFLSVIFSIDPCVFVGVCLSSYHSTTTTTTRSPTTSPRSSRLTLRPQVRVHHQHHRYNLIWYNLHLVNPSSFRVPYLSGVAHLVFAKHCALALESDSV